ncbi:Transthyretin-like family-containing protein [Strongyloides ratti]|uniref:Transthyretin-like family-containing protein n=1 Tax=Strongyloides ratti TaxID=34506 RepID=A0A090MSA1_STRRB|nr:Transthyretin-like family-containing protein [Strongyloides ratti]CEF61128.1 Transthyretin-like family-containing protein [Strongyloides ratti]
MFFLKKHKFGLSGYLQCPYLLGGLFEVTLSSNYNTYEKNPLAKVRAKLNTSFDIYASVTTLKTIHPCVKIYHNCFRSKSHCLGLIIIPIPQNFVYKKKSLLNFYSLGKFDLSRQQSHILDCGIKKNRRTI